MSSWFEILGIVLLILSSILLGRICSKLRRPYCVLSCLLPNILIATFIMERFYYHLCFIYPFSWILSGQNRFMILALAIPMSMTILISHLPHKWEKIIVGGLMLGFVVWSSILPLFVPILIKDHLSNLKTRFDKKGICIQTTNYTCGPAAAVTALGKFGLSGKEEEIAVLSYTSPIVGTLPSLLCSALQKHYKSDGLKCEYRKFDSIEQLKDAGVTLVIIKISFISDHCVTVLGVWNDVVVIADPVTGIELIPRKEFKRIWRFSGIVFQRSQVN